LVTHLLAVVIKGWARVARDQLRAVTSEARVRVEMAVRDLERALEDDLSDAILNPARLDATKANLTTVVPDILQEYRVAVELCYTRSYLQPVSHASRQAMDDLMRRLHDEVVERAGLAVAVPELPPTLVARQRPLGMARIDIVDLQQDAETARRAYGRGWFRRIFRGGGEEEIASAQRRLYRAVISRCDASVGESAADVEADVLHRIDQQALACREAWQPLFDRIQAESEARRDALTDELRAAEMRRADVSARRDDLSQAVKRSLATGERV
jgi:hypothetical protein